MSEENKGVVRRFFGVVRRFFAELINAGRMDRADAVVTADEHDHPASAPHDGLKDCLIGYFALRDSFRPSTPVGA